LLTDELAPSRSPPLSVVRQTTIVDRSVALAVQLVPSGSLHDHPLHS